MWNIADDSFHSFSGEFSEREPPNGDKIGAPYVTNNVSGYYYELPEQRIFSYNSHTRGWSSSKPLPKDIDRTTGSAYTQSARNKVGFSFGGYLVPGENFAKDEIVFADNSWKPWIDKMVAYDLKTGEFNVTQLPALPNGDTTRGIGPTVHAIMHSLDRVGNEGILVAFAGAYSFNDS